MHNTRRNTRRIVTAALLVGGTALLLSGCEFFGPPKRAPVVQYGVQSGAGTTGVHMVGSGDTLWNIAQRYRLSMQDIIARNKLYPPYVLTPGQRLSLPPPNEYRVQRGDSLYTVSRLFNVSTTELARLNSLSAPYTIHAGEKLRLPALSSAKPARLAHTQEIAAPDNMPARRVTNPADPVQAETLDGSPPQPKAKPRRLASIPDSPVPPTPPRAGNGKFAWPVNGPVISAYGPKEGGLHNDGINIAAARGTPVRAAENGVVVYADNELKGFGNLILIRHEDRWMTAYAHLDRSHVRRGDTVKAGQAIGTVGQSGSVDTPQLHFEVRRGTEALNPQIYLGRAGS